MLQRTFPLPVNFLLCVRNHRQNVQFDEDEEYGASRKGMVMSAYVITTMEIHSSEWVDEYFAKIPHVILAHGGRFVARCNDVERLEGDSATPDGAFILQFSDRAQARAFWNSEEFKYLRNLRNSGSTVQALLVDGVEGAS